MVNLFSVPAFFIVLREVLEACLVVGIVLAYLKKAGATHLNKIVWWAALTGIAVSLLFGITFVTIYYVQGKSLFAGKAEKIFEGIVFLIAAALLTWMIIWMGSMGKKLQGAIENKVELFIESDGNQGKIGLFTMVFIQVLREGIETWIFLFGATTSTDDEGAWRSIPIPGILAIIVGLAMSYAVFRGMVMLDLTKLFLYSSIVLMAFSAGLVSHAFHELQEADWFGPWKPVAPAQKDWYNARMWSTKACCHDKENQFFAFLRALFGYQDTPTFVEWGTYFGYWIIVAAILIAINWKSVRAARKYFANLAKNLSSASLLVSFIGFIYAVSNPMWNGIVTMTVAFILSIVATLASYDFFSKQVSAIAGMRRLLALGSGAGFGLLTLFMTVMHIVQMGCDESTTCNIPKFYYFGLIFVQDWAMQGRAEDNNSWVSIAVLSWSLVVSVFFFGTLSFALIMYSRTITSDGVDQSDSEAVKAAEEDAVAQPDVNMDVAEVEDRI